MMQTIYLDPFTLLLPEAVATIGFFDGVHTGHQYLIRKVVETARNEGRASMVVTFDRHPREVLHTDYLPEMLSSLPEKLIRLSETGIDHCIIVPFNEQTAARTAEAFMLDVLHRQLNIRKLIIGYDNRFGRRRDEGFEDYVRYGSRCGMVVERCDAFVSRGKGMSSSRIRTMLNRGEVAEAREGLGRPYSLTGVVEAGHRIGREIGFPTANLRPVEPRKLIPHAGVYAVKVTKEGWKAPRQGMMNIGRRPTFDGNETTIEVHILDLTEDLYGSSLSVAFMDRIRDERRFKSREELILRLHEDEIAVRTYFQNHQDIDK